MRVVIITFSIALLFLTGSGFAADWPQWFGPNRDGISSEKGLLKDWPDSGPAVLWRTPLGEGFSSIAVARGAAYTMFAEGKDEYAICLDAATGEERWRVKTGSNFPDWQGGNGPRSTPIIDRERAFFLGAYGQLYALDVEDGEIVWSHHFQTEFISDPPHWGFSTSPLLEGKLLIVEVGGASGNSFIAFDKTTGEVVGLLKMTRLLMRHPLRLLCLVSGKLSFSQSLAWSVSLPEMADSCGGILGKRVPMSMLRRPYFFLRIDFLSLRAMAKARRLSSLFPRAVSFR